MNILVTGGAGFIGSNFLFYEIEKYKDDNFICVDSLTYAGNYETIKPLESFNNYAFYQADIRNKESLNKIFLEQKVDVVVNFAAESHVDRSILGPRIFLETNILGTQVLLDLCVKFETKLFYQISTDEVYGDLPIDKPELLFTESTPLNPSSPYSVSKASADMLTLSYFRTYQLPTVISRCSNNYGPYQFPEKLIPLMISNAMNNKKLPVYGKGLNVRDWLYVEDHCSAIDLIMRQGQVGQVYNIGANNERANIDIVKLILKELDKDESLIEFVEDRKGHDLRYAIDSSKLQKTLNWKANTNFEDGIKSTIEWYKENKTWYEMLLE